MATSIRTNLIPIVDSNGLPYPRSTDTACRIFVCDIGTTALKSLFSDKDLSIAAANPITVTAGHHAMRFIANTAYKIVTEINGTTTIGSGTTLSDYSADNIDPGISVGTGSVGALLGVAGVGSIGAFRTLIAAPSQTEMNTATTDIANHATWIGYNLTAKSRQATGTTAQQPAAGTAGAYRFDTTLALPLVDNGSAWKKYAIEGKLDHTYAASGSGACWTLQRRYDTLATETSVTEVIPNDDTIPLIAEGKEFITFVWTPQSASSRTIIDIGVPCDSAGVCMAALFISNTCVATAEAAATSGNELQLTIHHEVALGSVSAVSISLRVGTNTGTMIVNGSNTFGGTKFTWMKTEEVLVK